MQPAALQTVTSRGIQTLSRTKLEDCFDKPEFQSLVSTFKSTF